MGEKMPVMRHPMRVSNKDVESPLPGYTSSVHKIIENAIEKNDLDFFSTSTEL